MWLSFPWRPTRRVVVSALVLTAATMLIAALSGLLPPGLPRDVVRGGFALFVIVMVLRAIDSRVGRLEDEGWSRERRNRED